MSPDHRVRISFIGAGGICEQRHLPNLAQIPGVELVTVCNRSAESSQRIRDQWGFVRTAADWRAVLAEPAVDAVFIGTWPYLHREISVAALAAGKHVFCQARLCMDWPEAQTMVAAAQAHPQLVNMVCPSPFRVRWEQTVKRLLRAGTLGELQSVAVTSTSAANCNPQQVTWRERKELSGLNILQVGIFAETLNAWCGDYQSLAAAGGVFLRDKRDADGQAVTIQVPQVVSIVGTLAGGVTCTELHSGLARGYERSEIVLLGSAATCRVDFQDQKVLLGSDAAPETLVDDVGQPWQVEQQFVEAVRAARRGEAWKVSPDFPEGARYMRKMQAIHASLQATKLVKLGEMQPD